MYGSGGQLRALWRLAIFVSLTLFADVAVSTFVADPLAWISAHTNGIVAAPEIIDVIAVLIAVTVVLRQIEALPWSAVALDASAWGIWRIATGAAAGTAAIATTSIVLLAGGALNFIPDNSFAFLSGDAAHSVGVAWMLATFRISMVLLPASLFEEMIFRGYVWTVFEQSLGARHALWITSVLFGLVHLQNPGANVLAIVNVMLAGACLGMVRAATQSLPAAWAAHFMWNFVMAALLHVSVSGLPMATPGYRAIVAGHDWLTGGNWGPEGGAVATVVLVGAVAIGAQLKPFSEIFPNFMRRSFRATAVRGS